MKFIPYFIACVGLLTACTDGGTPSSGYGRPDNFQPGTRPYENAAKTANKHITNMIITNDAQAIDNIASLLKGYSGEKISDNLKIADAAIQIAAGTVDVGDIDTDVLNPALYVISPKLFSACGTDTDVASCIDKWRNENTSDMNKRLEYLREWAQPIDINDATFASTAGTILKFAVDDLGNIKSITVDDTEYTRDGTTNKFTSDNKTLTYDSASAADFKLSYSDFGMYNIANDGTAGQNIPFAGGYESRRIADITTVTEHLDFDGVAVGVVKNGDKSLNLKDGTAHLVFDNSGASPITTFGAKFSNWYNFTVTQDGIESPAIKFDKNPTQNITDGFDPSDNGSVSMDIGYYGPTGIPTEATGTVQYNESDGIKMDVAFGVKG